MKRAIALIILGLLVYSCTSNITIPRPRLTADGFKIEEIAYTEQALKNKCKFVYETQAMHGDVIDAAHDELMAKIKIKNKIATRGGTHFVVTRTKNDKQPASIWLYSRLIIADVYDCPKKTVVVKKVEPKKEKTTTKTEKKVEATSGSAFFVSNTGYIITNFHVIETCNNNSKIFYKTNEIDTKLIAKDEYLDLALLKAEVSNNKFITISNKAPRKLQRIIAAGYPFGKYLSDDMKFTSGIVSSLKGIKDDSTRLQIDAALNPGNSGGPIVDENTGKLVAVAVAGLRKDMTEAVNFGIKAGSVKNFLEANQIDITTFAKSYSRGEIAGLLESTVLYTFCN